MSDEAFTLEAQMGRFLLAMGFRFEESNQLWRLTDTQVWSNEELRRMWLQAHGRRW
jgi:hypothetical protein